VASKRSFAAQIDQRAAQVATTPADALVGKDNQQSATAPAAPAQVAQDEPVIAFRKFTVPIRTDQLSELANMIAHIQLDQGVSISKALVIRYGLALVLKAAQDEPDHLLQQLATFEQMELDISDNRKYSISGGLDRFKGE
jgi:hypothetical protein